MNVVRFGLWRYDRVANSGVVCSQRHRRHRRRRRRRRRLLKPQLEIQISIEEDIFTFTLFHFSLVHIPFLVSPLVSERTTCVSRITFGILI